MISGVAINWLAEHFGEQEYPYTHTLQDFENIDIRSAIKEHGVKDWDQLRAYLLSTTNNEEAIAHLWGDENAESRRQSIQAIKAIQEKMCDPYTSTEDDAFENIMNKLLSGEMTYEEAIEGEKHDQ